MRLGFEHSYASLPARFHERVRPTPVADPALVVLNGPLAEQLGLDPASLEARAAALLSGNELAEDADPIAMAYAGHQFGHFVPQLGDGRALLLGELRARDGALRDVHLKGSGRTRFSRGGDGRAALGPMLREYLVSEAMHALGIPTTRSLAVVGTGERVLRDTGPLPGAVLTRVAASHVRVGTFEYFGARGDTDGVRALLDYVIARHYPQARAADAPALAVLDAVVERQATLIAHWVRVGFIHGVMNTDNMAISGETIDYGPCAFMDQYDAQQVFSSIDRRGRYAYANQPAIAKWNLARFAETLLPLVHPDGEQAVGLATEALQRFDARFDAQLLAAMRRKIGLASAEQGDAELVARFLACLQAGAADFTLAFRRLADAVRDGGSTGALRELFPASSGIDEWLGDWRRRLERDPREPAARAADMYAVNPAFIPRNHRVEAALQAASDRGDLAPLHRLLEVLRRPYDDQPDAAAYMQPPEAAERVLQTFCGT
jgi:uncharacterized protein YdiU (UPF0061 family)